MPQIFICPAYVAFDFSVIISKKCYNIGAKLAQKGGHDMGQTIYDYIALGAAIATVIVLVALLIVATAGARAKMTPEERAELDDAIRRNPGDW
jgi:hypothetical protein